MNYQTHKYRDNLKKKNKDLTYKIENTYLNINKALEFVGDNSKFQKQVILIFSVQWMIFSFLIMGMPFLFQQPIFNCFDFELNDGSYYFCSETEACKIQEQFENKPELSKQYKPFVIDKEHSSHSLALDYELYCERRYLVGTSGSVFFLGAAVAGYVFPQMAERKGRKEAILASILVGGISLLFAGFSQHISQFIFFLFFAGIGLNGFETLSLVYVTEISAENFRNFSSVILTSAWASAQIIFSAVSYYMTYWRYVCIFMIGIPFILTYYFSKKYLLETPRYLVSKQKFEQARQVLSQISITNGRPRFEYKIEGELEEDDPTLKYVDPVKYLEQEQQKQNYITPEKQAINYTYIDLFRHKSLRNLTISMILLWIFRYITYFGQAFSISSLGSEMHANLVMIGMSEVVACLIAGPVKSKLKRIKTMSIFAFIASVCCILTIVMTIPEECYLPEQTCIQKGLLVIFAQAIKFSITLYMSILITYTSEVYPTVVRSLGYGVCMTAGKGGTIIMPLIVSYFQAKDVSPLIVFGIFGLFVVFVILKLPETKDTQMKDFLEEKDIADVPMIDIFNKDNDQNQNDLSMSQENNIQ